VKGFKGFRVEVSGFKAKGAALRIQNSGINAQGSGLRVLDFRA
jgi:hypothetical protein